MKFDVMRRIVLSGVALLGGSSVLAQGQGSAPNHQAIFEMIDNLSSKVDEIPPVWSRALSANDTTDFCNSSRFKCVMDDNAVLDKETGLVWERSPDDTTTRFDWSGAKLQCLTRRVGNRAGWRLPSIHDLWSLTELVSGQVNPQLPPGHPFLGSIQGTYWSATTNPATDEGRAIDFQPGGAAVENDAAKTTLRITWCVRGGTTNAGDTY